MKIIDIKYYPKFTWITCNKLNCEKHHIWFIHCKLIYFGPPNIFPKLWHAWIELQLTPPIFCGKLLTLENWRGNLKWNNGVMKVELLVQKGCSSCIQQMLLCMKPHAIVLIQPSNRSSMASNTGDFFSSPI